MSEQDLIELAKAGVQAFSSGDWDWLKAHTAADVVYEEVGTGQRIQGIDELVGYLQTWRVTVPDSSGTVTRALASGDTAVVEITWDGHQSGPLQTPGGTVPPSGKRAITRAVQVIQYEDNRAKEVHHYLDILGFMQQIGAAPMGQAAATA